MTDKACNSLTLAADAKATKNTVFQVKNLVSMDSKGSKGCLVRAHNTVGKSQFGNKGLTEGFELKIPLIKSVKVFSELTELLLHPL